MSLRNNFPDQFFSTALPMLESLIFDELEQYPDMVPEIFQVKGSNSWGEQTSTMAGLGAAQQKYEGGETPEDAPIQGYDKTYTFTTYALKCQFPRELISDDRLGMAEGTYRSLGMSAYQVRHVTAFNVINNGFSVNGPDGATLFSTSHTMIGGHTYANRPAADIALSVGGLRALEILAGKQVNHRNLNAMLMMSSLLIPPDLMQVVEELVGSPDRPDTANRAINTFKKRNYKVVMCPFLTATAAWAGFAPVNQCKLYFYEREAPHTTSWIDNDSGNVLTKIEFRQDVGYSDFVGAFGSNP